MPLSPNIDPATLPVGNPNNNFSAVGGAIAGQKVLTTIYDLAPWNVLRSVYQRHSIAPSFRMLVKAFGSDFSRGVAAPTTGHYEQDWDSSLIEIGSIVTPASGAGGDMVVALSAASMYNTAVTQSGVARKASYPQENQRIQLPDGTMAFVKSKNVTTDPHRLTLSPINAAENLNNSVTAGEKYFSPDNAWGEGTALPKGKLNRIYKYSNTFQIVKQAFGATGSAITTEFYPRWKETDSNIIMILEAQTIRDYERDISGALLFGQQMDNITATDSKTDYDVPVYGTEGLIKFALTNGHQLTYTPGSFSLQDIAAVAKIYEQERIGGARTIVTFDGFDLYAEREDALASQYQYTLAPKMMASWISDSDFPAPSDGWQPTTDEDFVAWLGFKGIHTKGYNFMFRMLHEFNEAIGAGSSDYDYSKWCIYMPLGNTVDQKTRQPRANFGYEWRQQGRYSREHVVATVSGVGVAGIGGYDAIDFAGSEYDFRKTGMVSEIAFHAACGNRIVIQRPS